MKFNFNFKEIISVSIILFSVIDILGAIPIIIDLRKKAGSIHAEQATIVAGILMITYLYLGISILKLFGVDVQSFAVAGGLMLFLIGFEMTLGRNIFKHETSSSKATSIVPLAFPIIAGAGTMTTIISLKAPFQEENIVVGILLNLLVVYIVLRFSQQLEKILGQTGADILRKVFGMILIAISIKLIKTNLF